MVECRGFAWLYTSTVLLQWTSIYPGCNDEMHEQHRRREVPHLKSIIGVVIGQNKNVVKKFLCIHRLGEIPICIQIDANGPTGLPNWWFNTNKKSILGYDILGFSSLNSLSRVMWCMIDVILLHQFVVQIAITKNLNVDSRLVSKSASTYFPNRVFSFRDAWSKLGRTILTTSASCSLLPKVLRVPAHRGLVHGVPSWHSCLPAPSLALFSLWPDSRGSRPLKGFQLVTVAFFQLTVARYCTSFEPLMSSCLIHPSSSSLLTSQALALIKMTVNSTPF